LIVAARIALEPSKRIRASRNSGRASKTVFQRVIGIDKISSGGKIKYNKSCMTSEQILRAEPGHASRKQQ
jgi:hypothetical protein